MVSLLKRLKKVAGMIIAQEDVADIGADHALLPLYLIENHMVGKAVIGELGDGPFQRAREAVANSGLSQQIQVRQGDGLQVLEEGEVSTVVLAGMGGDTICEILTYDRKKAESYKRFVFQPMSKYEVLRSLLAEWGWMILEEDVVCENEHFYVLISAEPSNTVCSFSNLELEIGAGILCADTEAKRQFLMYYLQKYRKRLAGLSAARTSEKRLEASNLEQEINELEAIVNAAQS